MLGEQDLCFGPYRLGLGAGQLWRDQESVKLTPKALAVLCLLVTRPGQVVTKDELFQTVWPDVVVGDDALTSCVQELRRALGDDARNPRYIETVHRRGFRFIAPVAAPAALVPSSESRSQNPVASNQEEESQKPALSFVEGAKDGEAAGFRLQALGLPLVSPPTHFWSSKVFILAAALLLIGTALTVHYLSRSTLNPQDSTLRDDPAPAALALPDKPSIAVMPFTNMSGDPEQEYFSDGLTDDLITALSRLSQLFVIARHSVFTYKGKAVKVQEVSKELEVRYVLEGSVRRTDERIRINAQLVDATTGHHVWAERYDRPLQDIFALQDEIVQKIVTTLGLQLRLQEQGVLVRKATDNLEAYDYYLQGMEYRLRFTKEANAQAQQVLERAIVLDPAYADAYAELGWSHFVEWSWQWSQDPQALERALALGQQAVALDDSLSRAHGLLGVAYARKQQYEQAIAEGERAVALDPNNADGYALQALMLSFAGRPADALRAIEQALRLNPHSPVWYLQELGFAYQFMGQYAEAIATYKQLLVRNPNFLAAYNNLAGNYVRQWDFQLSPDPQTLERALEAAQRTIALNDTYPGGHVWLGWVYLFQKQYELAIAEMEQGVALAPHEAVYSASLAEALSRLGRRGEAVAMGEQALRRKSAVADYHLSNVGAAYYLAGRPEVAIVPLKQYLSRYPNHLGPHLTLTAVHSELGKEAEAQAEAAEVLRLNPTFSLEVHKERTPIKDPAMLERHIAALRKAGLK
jgi:TolB-like protein/DNA-binding winged helix-turn-helix (wHTH) protein/Flp pilus assembly protein TadD